MSNVSFPLAFLAGLLSFLSPCVLPLIPSYVSVITGLSFENLTSLKDASDEERAGIKMVTIKNSAAFVLGFSSIFIGLGASSSEIGQWLFLYQHMIRIVGGIVIIIFGLFISGILKPGFLMRERRFHMDVRRAGYAGAFLIGMTFAAGWTPCIGPILGSILLVAATKGSAFYGLKLLAVYSLGLAVPFFAAALALNSFLSYSRRIMKFMPAVMVISGIIMIGFGVLLLTNHVRELTGFLSGLGINTEGLIK